MKILSDSAINLLEKELESFLQGDKYYATLRFKPIDTNSYLKAETYLNNNKISYSFVEGVIYISLTELLDKYETVEENLWGVNNKTQFVLVSDLDHQRLSNMFWFLEVLLLNNSITKTDSEDYLDSLKREIVPVIENKYNGLLLDYKPFYDWERTLYEKVKDKLGKS